MQEITSRTPCLPANARKELEKLRTALHTALCWWGSYYADLKSWQDPPLFRSQGEEAEDYRRCIALLDPGEAG